MLYIPEHKIVIDPFTRKVLIGQLVLDYKLCKDEVTYTVDSYFSTNLSNLKCGHGLEFWVRDSSLLEMFLTEIANALKLPSDAPIKRIIYSVMKVQQVWDEHSRKRTAKVKNTWVVQDDGYEAIVSGYSWNIICIRYPWCQGKEKKSLIKLDMDRDTMTKYDNLVRNNPWSYVPIQTDGAKVAHFSPSGPLYCPEEWKVDTIEIAETFMEEEDTRIFNKYFC